MHTHHAWCTYICQSLDTARCTATDPDIHMESVQANTAATPTLADQFDSQDCYLHSCRSSGCHPAGRWDRIRYNDQYSGHIHGSRSETGCRTACNTVPASAGQYKTRQVPLDLLFGLSPPQGVETQVHIRPLSEGRVILRTVFNWSVCR
jgi:hypothetical protein